MKLKISILYILFLLLTSDAVAQRITLGTYAFKDGSEYKGEMVGGKPNGKGTTVFKNGDNYEGEYVKGKRPSFLAMETMCFNTIM